MSGTKLKTNRLSSTTRRGFLAGTTALAVGVAAGCADKNAPGTTSAGGSVRFSWWGSAPVQAAYSKAAQAFMSQNPKIKLQLEPSEYASYNQRLAVQAAARNLPDIVWVPTSQFLTYATKNVLYDLNKLPQGTIDYGDFDAKEVDTWKAPGGQQYSAVFSQLNPCIQINKDLLAAAGIDMPDDTAWTWDDMGVLLNEFSKAKGKGFYGTGYTPDQQLHVMQWIRQHGQDLFNADGSVGVDEDVVGAWLSMWQKWLKDGSVMPPQTSGGGTSYPEVSKKVAVWFTQADSLVEAQAVTDGELVPLLAPADPSAAPGYSVMWYNRVCIAANSKNPELAGKFIDFFINDPVMVTSVGVIKGPPSNPVLRKQATKEAEGIAAGVIKIVERGIELKARPRPEVPPGGSAWPALMTRTAQAVAVGSQSVSQAVKAMLAELRKDLADGSK